MRRTTTLFLVFFYFSLTSYSQDNSALLLQSDLPEHYLNIELDTRDQISDLANHYSIDHIEYNPAEAVYEVRIWLSKPDYPRFAESGMPFTFHNPDLSKSRIAMAKNFQVLASGWDRYPTYQAYEETMSHFQLEHPEFCRIDTIMAHTPAGHKILAARIGKREEADYHKPAVFYSAAIHGDEVVGYYILLRFIDYILTHPDEPVVNQILEEIDLWICPLENPDGTYYSGDHIVGLSPISTRGNSQGYDLNRSYPGMNGNTSASYLPEIEAMMDFTEKNNFVMSIGLHSGAEIFNYPWDAYTSFQKNHPDSRWWNLIGRKFVDTCRKNSPRYFNSARDGVTPGGNWYIIRGSRQDFMNYHRRCREATLEISYPKIADRQQLPVYWENLKDALLNYTLESLYGIKGIVKDAATGEPLRARIFIEGYDDPAQNSDIFSALTNGIYHRPLIPGTYTVTFSSDGYITQTHDITVHYGTLFLPVNLDRSNSVDENTPSTICLYPNPASDQVNILIIDPGWLYSRINILNTEGKILRSITISDYLTILDLNAYPPGIYFINIHNKTGNIFTEKILKK